MADSPNMKAFSFTLLLLLLASAHGLGQTTQLSFAANIGAWRSWLPYDDPYASDYRHVHPAAGLAVGARLPIGRRVAFAPRIGLALHGMAFEYSNTKSVRTAYADMWMGDVQATPMVSLDASGHLRLSGGVCLSWAAFSAGSFSTRAYLNGWQDPEVYDDRLGSIRNPLLWGPVVMACTVLPLASGDALELGLQGFLGMNGVFRKSLQTPFNPRIATIGLAVAYIFGKQPDT